MIFDLLAPPQGPTAGQKKCAVARPIHVSNSHTKCGWFSSNGLGGDSLTDGRTEAIAISPSLFKKKRGIINTNVTVSKTLLQLECQTYSSSID